MSLRFSPDARWRTIDGEVVIISQRAGEVMGLNETGSLFIDLLAAGQSWEQIVSTLAEEFDAPVDVIAGEIGALARELVSSGVLIGTVPGSPAEGP